MANPSNNSIIGFNLHSLIFMGYWIVLSGGFRSVEANLMNFIVIFACYIYKITLILKKCSAPSTPRK